MSGEHVNAGNWAEQLPARIGCVALYATPAELVAVRRSRGERAARTFLTLVGSWIAAPVAFLIPPHLESVVLVLLAGLYFARRAWVGEFELARLSGTCPRCSAPLTLRRGSVLYLPHSLSCSACRAECWLELGAAPVIAESLRQEARARVMEQPRARLDGQPPLTWSPAASDWRDRSRE